MQAPSSADIEWVKLAVQALGLTIGWLLVIVGWSIANSHARAREYRKEVRGFIDEIKEQAIAATDDAIALWKKDGKDTNANEAIDITVKIQRLSHAVLRLRRVSAIDCTSQIRALRQAATSEDFYSSTRLAANSAQLRQRLISAALMDLEREIEDGFYRHYDARPQVGRVRRAWRELTRS